MSETIGLTDVVEEILRTKAHLALWDIVKYAAFGVVGGLVLSVGLWKGLRAAGAFELAWRHAVWARRLACLWILIALSACGGLIGGCQGLSSGITRVLRESQLRTEVLQPAAEAGAVGMVIIDSVLADFVAGRTPAEAAGSCEPRVEAFCKGEGTLDGAAFFGLLEKAQEPAIAKAIEEAKGRAHAKLSIPATGMTASIVDTVLEQVVRYAAKSVVEDKLLKLGIAEAVREFRDEMPQGPLGYKALSDHLVEHAAIPLLTMPARKAIRGKQMIVGILGVVALALPIAGFWVARRRSPKT